MLNRRFYFQYLFSLGYLFFIVFPLMGQEYHIKRDSTTIKQTLEQVEAFKRSINQKELNAYVSSQILTNKDYKNIDLQALLQQHLKNLLNEFLIDEGYAFVDSLQVNGFFELPQNKWRLPYWLALCDFFADKEKQAMQKLDSAIYLAKSSSFISSGDYGVLSYFKGLFYYYLKDQEEALPYFFQAIDLIEQDDKLLMDAYHRIVTIYTIKKDYRKALLYVNRGIAVLLDGHSEKEFEDGINRFPLLQYGELIQFRAYVYREFAIFNNDSLQYLELSLQDVQKSVYILEKYKRNLVFESDALYLNRRYKYFYSKTIEALYRLYEVTGEDSLIEQAMEYSEMEKVSALLYTIQRNKALYQSGIPAEKVKEIEQLYKKLNQVEAKRYQEQANINLNNSDLFGLNMQLNQLIQSINTEEVALEKNYPGYREIKYDVHPPGLDSLYEMSKEKAIVEYVVSSDRLYIFTLVDCQLQMKVMRINRGFVPLIDSLQQMVSNVQHINFSLTEQKQFMDLSHRLYSIVLQPVEKIVADKPLLIVPDEQLALIPFEILVKTVSPQTRVNYNKLDYLIKHQDISYAYSLTLMQKQEAENTRKNNHRIFAVAPGYEHLAGNPGSQYVALRDARDNLGVLEGARKEVKQVGKHLKGKLLIDEAASEEQFKKEAGKYSVLHLAMHTLINNEEPLYSKMLFTPDADTAEDGLLNTYELADLELDADLVVLSACNTGFGKLNKGEGIVGLSRGFFQAGCKSLLATLWSVSDKTSLKVIDGFYSNLQDGKSKSESISQTKRAYLQETKGMWAHPFFWAGYIVIGDDEPLQLSIRPISNYGWFIGITLVLGIGLFIGAHKILGSYLKFKSKKL